MTLPTVHLNGTSGARLLEQWKTAGDRAYALLDALSEAAPNARDYYPQGDGAFERARKEHDARCEKVRAVLEELATGYEALMEVTS